MSDLYWTARFAPYVLAVASSALVVSMFWRRPLLSYALLFIASGVFVFLFHVLRWRTGRELFQLAAMASGFLPLWYAMARLQGKITWAAFQYLAIFMITYAVAVVIFWRRLRRGSEPTACAVRD